MFSMPVTSLASLPLFRHSEGVSETLIAEIVAAEAELKGPSPDAWFARLDGDPAGLEEALGWSLEHDLDLSIRLAGAVWPYWLARGRLDSGRAWLTKVLAASEWGERTAARAKALYGAGTLAFTQGDRDPSLRLHTESLAIARELGDQGLEADALIGLARVAELDGDGIMMEQNAQRSIEAARAAADPRRVAIALALVADAKRRQGRDEESPPPPT
jgi:non-specific serine/threonine protein kinase